MMNKQRRSKNLEGKRKHSQLCHHTLKNSSLKETGCRQQGLGDPLIPMPQRKQIPSLYKEQHIDGQGGVIILKAAMVSLHIPAGALSERTRISIEVKSATDPNMSTSLTPVVSCRPDGQKFHKPVELIVPHCAEFDDISLHNAKVQFNKGDMRVTTDNNGNARCVLKERYCHIYTTHFSDVKVNIRDCLKKRMIVVPFNEWGDILKVNVWILNDLPSEYTILLHEQEKTKFVPFNHSGKFILDNNDQCSLKVETSFSDMAVGPKEVIKKLDIRKLFSNIRNVYEFKISMEYVDKTFEAVTVSLLKEPVFHLSKKIHDDVSAASLSSEVSHQPEDLDILLFERMAKKLHATEERLKKEKTSGEKRERKLRDEKESLKKEKTSGEQRERKLRDEKDFMAQKLHATEESLKKEKSLGEQRETKLRDEKERMEQELHATEDRLFNEKGLREQRDKELRDEKERVTQGLRDMEECMTQELHATEEFMTQELHDTEERMKQELHNTEERQRQEQRRMLEEIQRHQERLRQESCSIQ